MNLNLGVLGTHGCEFKVMQEGVELEIHMMSGTMNLKENSRPQRVHN